MMIETGNVAPELADSTVRLLFNDPTGSKGADAGLLRNWRPIELQETLWKVLSQVVMRHVQAYLNSFENMAIDPQQEGFVTDGSTSASLTVLNLAIRQRARQGQPIVLCFIDFSNAFGSVTHEAVFGALRAFGIPRKVARLLTNRMKDSVLHVVGQTVERLVGAPQGDSFSPLAFVLLLELALRLASLERYGLQLEGISRILTYLAFADDVALMAENFMKLQAMLTALDPFLRTINLRVNTKKTVALFLDFSSSPVLQSPKQK